MLIHCSACFVLPFMQPSGARCVYVRGAAQSLLQQSTHVLRPPSSAAAAVSAADHAEAEAVAPERAPMTKQVTIAMPFLMQLLSSADIAC